LDIRKTQVNGSLLALPANVPVGDVGDMALCEDTEALERVELFHLYRLMLSGI